MKLKLKIYGGHCDFNTSENIFGTNFTRAMCDMWLIVYALK